MGSRCRTFLTLLACALLASLAACAAPGNDAPATRSVGAADISGKAPLADGGSHAPTQMAGLAARLPDYRFVLLGEVHDNAAGHALRRAALEQALAAGWRPVLAMEQFDRENQALLDQALQRCSDAACVIDAAAPQRKGWNWAYYEPIVELALKYRLPVVAANLSRKDAARIMQQGLASVFSPEQLNELGLSTAIEPSLLQSQEAQVAHAHCDMLPPGMSRGMAVAQIARDATMALAMRAAAGSGAGGVPVVLLAGNGHVDELLGVPYWLARGAAESGERRVLAVGFVEQQAPEGSYDEQVRIRPADRPDPCEAFLRQRGARQ